jgi:proline iminopeptidase
MSILYPEIEPYCHNMLDVGDGNQIYWETCGNPGGKPVIVLHGGPGSGCTPRLRCFFDPALYRIVLFDQRGCGRSKPQASDITTELSSNTTWRLIADMERLRENLGVDRWMVFGGSWGSTLGLVYAETYPQHVSDIILWGVAMTRPKEIEWLYYGVAPLFPEQWARFTRGLPDPKCADDILNPYFHRLHSADPVERVNAARDFHEWEWALFSNVGDATPGERWLDPAFQVARARIVTHYFLNRAWLEDGILLRNAERLAGIPGIMVHGNFDVGSPLVSAWELAHAWPGSELVIVRGAGHSTTDPGMDAALVEATNRLSQR